VLPARKFGIYIGLFNLFIVIPQLIVATAMGGVMRSFFPDQPKWTMLVAALVMAGAVIAMARVQEQDRSGAQRGSAARPGAGDRPSWWRSPAPFGLTSTCAVHRLLLPSCHRLPSARTTQPSA
jgi:hypothetical protein